MQTEDFGESFQGDTSALACVGGHFRPVYSWISELQFPHLKNSTKNIPL